MAASLKQMAACIRGLPANFSVLRDFYGFWEGMLPTVTGGAVTLSLKNQFAVAERTSRPHQHHSGRHHRLGRRRDHRRGRARVPHCVRHRGAWVGRVSHFVISDDDADGMDVIDSESEKFELLGKKTAGMGGIDVFMVRDIDYGDGVVGSAGYIPDDCGDKPDSDKDGLIVDVNRTAPEVARTFTHELGHFLGLSHPCGESPECLPPCLTDNLMTHTGCVPLGTTALNLTSSQGDKMLCHFMVQRGC